MTPDERQETPHMFNRLKDERGFTLIELLVVVLIIGIRRGRCRGEPRNGKYGPKRRSADCWGCGADGWAVGTGIRSSQFRAVGARRIAAMVGQYPDQAP
jgi:prepilin-type N-terminal cleavage/methylation domain-containing protein